MAAVVAQPWLGAAAALLVEAAAKGAACGGASRQGIAAAVAAAIRTCYSLGDATALEVQSRLGAIKPALEGQIKERNTLAAASDRLPFIRNGAMRRARNAAAHA
eukprot:1449571-Prorocentrum_lima.AAC.1